MDNNLEQRVANIEGTVSQMNERLNHLGDEMIGLRGEINGIREKIDSNFKWLIFMILSSWITIIGTFIGFFIAMGK